MLISEKDFSKYIKKLDKDENVLIYAEEASDGSLVTSMFGESSKVIAAMQCLIDKYADKQGLTAEEVLKSMLAMNRLYRAMQEGRDY